MIPNIETEAIKSIVNLHLEKLTDIKVTLVLNANQVLGLVDLLDAALETMSLNEHAAIGFAELAGELEVQVLNVYPDIEPYLNRISVLEEKNENQ